MTTENLGENAGTEILDTSASTGVSLDDLLGPQEEATPAASQQEQGSNDKSGDSRGSDGAGKETVRSLAELNDAANNSNIQLTDAEKQKVKIAARKGLTSDEEIDAELHRKLNEGTQNEEQPTKNEIESEPSDSEDNDQTDEPNEIDSDDGSVDVDDTSSMEQALQSLIKTAAPHAKGPEDAEQAIKNLQYTLQRQGEFINTAKKLGVTSPEQMTQAIQSVSNIDKTIEQHLKTPEGLKKLYETYNVEMPTGIVGARSEQTQSDTSSIDLGEITEKVNREGFIEAEDFSKLIPALQKAAEDSASKKMEAMEAQLKQVGTFLEKQTETMNRNQEMQQVFEEAAQISSTFGAHDKRLALEATPIEIYKASIDESGRALSKPHPEFKKLQNIVKIRKQAFQEAEVLSQKLGKTVMPDTVGYLSKLFMTNGGFKSVVHETKKNGNQKLLSNLARAIQTGPKGKNKGVTPDTFKVPKTEQDVANMSAKDRKRLLEKAKNGQFSITV